MPDLFAFRDPPLLDDLPVALHDRLWAAGQTLRYEDGSLVHGRGDDTPGFSVVREGSVRFSKTLANGKQLTVGTLHKGSTFGEATIFGGQPRAYDAFAVGAARVHQIKKPAFERLLAEEPQLAHLLLQSLTKRLYGTLRFLDDIRSLPTDVCVAKMLSALAGTGSAETTVDCRQEDIAMTLGVSRVSVGHALTRLKSEGIIELGYRQIQVPEPSRLSQWVAQQTA